jgi:hypothetical protein
MAKKKKKLDPALLRRLDEILSEVNDAIDELDPDGEAAGALFGPVQELGWAVDELLGRHS